MKRKKYLFQINIIFKKVKGNLLLNKLNFREIKQFIFETTILTNENEFKKRSKDYINQIILKSFQMDIIKLKFLIYSKYKLYFFEFKYYKNFIKNDV